MNHKYEKKIWLHWNMTGDDIVRKSDELINKSKINYDQIASFKIDALNIKQFLGLLSDDITEFTSYHSMAAFLQYVSPDPQVRKASTHVDVTPVSYTHLRAHET